jgi:hypothetical protein
VQRSARQALTNSLCVRWLANGHGWQAPHQLGRRLLACSFQLCGFTIGVVRGVEAGWPTLHSTCPPANTTPTHSTPSLPRSLSRRAINEPDRWVTRTAAVVDAAVAECPSLFSPVPVRVQPREVADGEAMGSRHQDTVPRCTQHTHQQTMPASSVVSFGPSSSMPLPSDGLLHCLTRQQPGI